MKKRMQKKKMKPMTKENVLDTLTLDELATAFAKRVYEHYPHFRWEKREGDYRLKTIEFQYWYNDHVLKSVDLQSYDAGIHREVKRWE